MYRIEHKQYWEGWLEFVEWVENARPGNGLSDSDCSSQTPGRPWSGTNSFADAITLARNGWNGADEQMREISDALFNRVSASLTYHEPYYDVEGSMLDIARYCSGEPEHWANLRDVETTSGHKHIKLVFNCMISSGISHETIIAKGATVLALVNLLELAGNRVEIVVCVGYGKAYQGYATVKNYDQPLDIPRCAFALASPAMARRLFFRVLEAQPNWKALGAQVGLGYGGKRGLLWTMDPDEKGDMYFGHSSINEPHWQRADSAEKWILRTAKGFGIESRESEVAGNAQ